MAKIALAPVLKELGSEMADGRFARIPHDPARAMQQMQTRLLEMVGESEMGIESILEDVLSMPVEKRLAFIGWLGTSNDPRAAKLLIPLLDNPSSKWWRRLLRPLEQLEAVASQRLSQLSITCWARTCQSFPQAAGSRYPWGRLSCMDRYRERKRLPSREAPPLAVGRPIRRG